jgi:hypothetical protein
MAGETTTSVSNDAGNAAEAAIQEIREKLKSKRNLPVLWPIEDRKDVEQNVIVRLLEEADKQGTDLATLLQGDPGIVWRKLEAERSHIRRQRQKLAKQMSDEMAQSLPAELALSEAAGAELIDRLTGMAGLSANESQFILLCYLAGEKDYDLICNLMALGKDELYRIAHKAKSKLEAVLPEVLEVLLEEYEHTIPPNPDERGVWKRFTARPV